MAIKTVSFQRTRSQVKTISNPTLGGAEGAYQAYEAAQAADTTKTWTVRVVNSYQAADGNFVIVAEGTYPEINQDPAGQVPEIVEAS